LKKRSSDSVAGLETANPGPHRRYLAGAVGKRNRVAVDGPAEVRPRNDHLIAIVQGRCANANENLARSRLWGRPLNGSQLVDGGGSRWDNVCSHGQDCSPNTVESDLINGQFSMVNSHPTGMVTAKFGRFDRG